MTQPEGFQSAGKEENLVCKLKKSLYEIKQAPRQWYLKLDSFMQMEGYKRCSMDHCCDLKKLAEDGKIKIDKFDGHDFGFWKKQIEDYAYQKKLHKPLAEAKPTNIKAEDWALLDRQALGAVRLSLAKNVAYNVVNEKTTYVLLKALSNMYEKPSTSNKVFLIRQLVITKMHKRASVADDVNEFNSILSRLVSVDIKLDDEVQALLLLSSFPESWSGTVTTVSGSTRSTKLKFNNIHDLILGEAIHRKTSREDKVVNMPARDYDDTLVCCVENTIDDRIMDSGASFHATYCKEELERFRLRSDKVRLADDKTLNIASVGDVVLKTSFGTS
ncbi:retrovirus-related pol polyprotein from transposon TNT 1-94 [Tanacetum coccineum]